VRYGRGAVLSYLRKRNLGQRSELAGVRDHYEGKGMERSAIKHTRAC
jgi:hypothetical protein